jgi:rhodanese-related sulfurtransferase
LRWQKLCGTRNIEPNIKRFRKKNMNFFTSLFQRSTVTQLDPDEVKALISQHPRPVLLDVRTPQEYKEYHIGGAQLIPLNELPDKLKRIPRDRTVVCVCASGNRSNSAARRLEKEGYKVSNMKGGMSRWMRSGLPVKKGMAR